jgi:hypothetical protein
MYSTAFFSKSIRGRAEFQGHFYDLERASLRPKKHRREPVIKSRVGFVRRYRCCTWGDEKKQATKLYQNNEIQTIIPTVVK